MREHEKAEVYRAAIELLLDAALAKAKIKTSAGAWKATTRADLTTRHRQTARELFNEHGELDAEQLALLLSADETPAPSGPTPPQPPTFVAGQWTPPTDADRELARARLAQIRELLRETA